MLLVERDDRALVDGQVARLHRQDLCQATGLPPNTKYEGEGGPSLQLTCDPVRDEVSDPLTASRSLLARVVFNVLIRNPGAHAKNVSIVRSPGGRQQLAPFYDLVCSGAYDLERNLAMAVGGRFSPGAIGRNAWDQPARDIGIGIGRALVLRTVKQMAAQLAAELPAKIAKVEGHACRLPRQAQVECTIRRRVRSAQGVAGAVVGLRGDAGHHPIAGTSRGSLVAR